MGRLITAVLSWVPSNEIRLSGGPHASQPHNTCTTSGQVSNHTTPRAAGARPRLARVRLRSDGVITLPDDLHCTGLVGHDRSRAVGRDHDMTGRSQNRDRLDHGARSAIDHRDLTHLRFRHP